jgi:hypothetical protein
MRLATGAEHSQLVGSHGIPNPDGDPQAVC